MIREFLLYNGFEYVDDVYSIKLSGVNTTFINYIYIFTGLSRKIINEYLIENPDEILYISINGDQFTLKTSLVQSYNTEFKEYTNEDVISIEHFTDFMKNDIRQMNLDKLNI